MAALIASSRLNDGASRMIQELLNARREEKNFTLRGFEKYGSDTKNHVQKWEDSQNKLLAQLGSSAAFK